MVLEAQRNVIAGLQTHGPQQVRQTVGRGVELRVRDHLAGARHDVCGSVRLGGGVDSGEHGSEGSGRYVPGVDPVARFTQLVTTADPPLDECALLIAATRSRQVDVAEQLSLLDALAAECPGTTLGALRRYLFRELGFRGNTDNYYAHDNSYLDEVLAHRTGIPITLGIVLVEVGRRIGIGLSIVGLPGHVVVGVDDRPGTFVDAFHDGALLDVEGCAVLLERIRGPLRRVRSRVAGPARPPGRLVAGARQHQGDRAARQRPRHAGLGAAASVRGARRAGERAPRVGAVPVPLELRRPT